MALVNVTGGLARWLALAFLLLFLALGAAVRIGKPLSEPTFLTDSPRGLMRSDPGLLFYSLERVVEAGGTIPPGLRADPNVEHPAVTDFAKLDTISQELPIAWAYLAFRPSVPLHVFAHWFMGVFAALTGIGVFFLAAELTGSWLAASLALALFSLLPANYRTLGLVLMREDFAFPFYAAHLWLFARASRIRTSGSAVLCALALAAALASWHAMGFIFTLEVLCLFAWFLRTGENPLRGPFAWPAPAVLVFAGLAVPVLRSSWFVLSLPMQVAAGLFAAAVLGRSDRAGRMGQTATALAVVVGLGLVRHWVVSRTGDDYSHVWSLMAAKIAHWGNLPADPTTVPFEARIMWQGPFATLSPAIGYRFLEAGLWLFVPAAGLAALEWRRGAGRAGFCLLAAFAAAALVNAWLVERVTALAGLLLPVVGALFVWRLPRTKLTAIALALVLGWQAYRFADFMVRCQITWYEPAYHTREFRALLDVLPKLVPPGEAVAADPVISTAVLSDARRPIVLQPKWERARSRVPIQDFLMAFYQGSPEDLRRLLLTKYRCRYVLFDRLTLWEEMRYMAGLPLSEPVPPRGTAAEAFLSQSETVLAGVPGYRLLYRSPSHLRTETGAPSDLLRLYELTP